jgi:hypothetical protein
VSAPHVESTRKGIWELQALRRMSSNALLFPRLPKGRLEDPQAGLFFQEAFYEREFGNHTAWQYSSLWYIFF